MPEISMEQMRAVFDEIDSDSSGSISESELMDALKIFGLRVTKNSAKRILKTIDKDGNGSIEWQEFSEFFSRVSDPSEVKNILAEQSQRFFEYKHMVEEDPSFAKTFVIPRSCKTTHKLDAHSEAVEAVVWLGENTLASGAIDGEIMIWDTQETRPRPRPRQVLEGKAAIYCMTTINGGRSLLAGLGAAFDNLVIWDLETSEPSGRLPGPDTPVYCCTMDQEGRHSASGSKSGSILIHDVASQALVRGFEAHGSVVYSCDFCRLPGSGCGSGNLLCTASADGSIKTFDFRTDSSAKDSLVIADAAASGSVFQALWRGSREIISCGDDYCIKRWDVRKPDAGPISCYFGHSTVVRAVDLSPDGEFLVSSTNDGSIRLWFVDEMKLIRDARTSAEHEQQRCRAELDQLEDKVSNGEVDPSELRSVGERLRELDGEATRLGAVEEERAKMMCTQASLALEGPRLPVVALAWGHNGWIAAGSHDQMVRVYDVDTSKLTALEPLNK